MRSRSERRVRLFWEWMVAMAGSAGRQSLPGRAAERRTIAALAPTAEAAAEEASPPVPPGGGRVARNTAIFSIATGISRIAGLAREIVAASFFGTRGPASAFTIAFQIPNLVRSE